MDSEQLMKYSQLIAVQEGVGVNQLVCLLLTFPPALCHVQASSSSFYLLFPHPTFNNFFSITYFKTLFFFSI